MITDYNPSMNLQPMFETRMNIDVTSQDRKLMIQLHGFIHRTPNRIIELICVQLYTYVGLTRFDRPNLDLGR